MAAMLAHEIKNPLAGIRGAAQLLEQKRPSPTGELAQLICDETDRMRGLVDRMEVFSDDVPPSRDAGQYPPGPGTGPQALAQTASRGRSVLKETLRSVAAAGVWQQGPADPGLPQPGEECRRSRVRGDGRGEIILTPPTSTASVAVPGRSSRVHLPLLVRVRTTATGIPEDIRTHLFEPFVTSKRNGTGLGLALVAKTGRRPRRPHRFRDPPRRTVFQVCYRS